MSSLAASTHHTEPLLGSEASARGAFEAGARLATGYPGTPATPAIEFLLANRVKEGMRVEWAVNEKVAVEVAAGHSWAGLRSYVAMKMSGLNVASDALFSIAASGTPGGLVILVGDDPGAYYGMVEQDSRLMAKMAVLPMVEPSTPADAKALTAEAFAVSEQTQTPILIRQTTTTANTCAPVTFCKAVHEERTPTLPDDPARYTKVSAAACQQQHADAIARMHRAAEALDRWNLHEPGLGRLGIIGAGSVWPYVEECFSTRDANDFHRLRVTVVNPLPEQTLVDLLSRCDRVLVVEELEPVIEQQARILAQAHRLNVEILGKRDGIFSEVGDLDPDAVENGLRALEHSAPAPMPEPVALDGWTPRTPTFCPGCPHRSTYAALDQAIRAQGHDPNEVLVTGDIGCTILGMNRPWSLCRTEVAMGSSIAMAQGFAYAGVKKPIIATIGDSTFYHAGIPPLLNASSREINLTVLVLDNSYAAMTGHQPTPSNDQDPHDVVANPLSIIELARAARVRRVKKAFPYFTKRLVSALKQSMSTPGVHVVIAEAPCAARLEHKTVVPYRVRPDKCPGLDRCSPCCIDAVGCPALHRDEETDRATIEQARCLGCGLCAERCPSKAIARSPRSARMVK